MRTDIVLVKLGAAFIVVTALGNFQHYVAIILAKPWWISTAIIAFFFAVIIPLLIALVFWKFPNTVVGSLYTNDKVDEDQSVATDGIYLVGVTLLGLYTLVFGFVELVHTETLRYSFGLHLDKMHLPPAVSPDTEARRIAGIVRIVIGIVLIVGRLAIVRLLQRVRTTGRPGS